jgi:hypothetical protein
VKDLPRGCDSGRHSFGTQEARIAPDLSHDLLRPRPRSDAGKECLHDGLEIQGTHAGINQQTEARAAIVGLVSRSW